MSQAPLLTLAIEISNPSGSDDPAHPGAGGFPGVALGRIHESGAIDLLGVEPLRPTSSSALHAEQPSAPGARLFGGHDDDLMPAIDRLMRSAGATPRELRRIAVSIGPGGYTGLRIACAAGKMLALAASVEGECRCIAVPSAMVVAARVRPEQRSRGPIAVALASKGNSAWVWIENSSDPGKLRTAADVPALAQSGVRTLIADRFLPPQVREAAAGAGIHVIPPFWDPAACLEASAKLPAIDPIELNPLYPREPDAVTLWRTRNVAQSNA